MRLNIPFIFNRRLFVLLFFAFIVASVVGTVSHECGHYVIGRLVGYNKLHISYKYTHIKEPNVNSQKAVQIYRLRSNEIKNHLPFPEQSTYYSLLKKSVAGYLWFTIGGPLETIGVGTIGFLLLIMYRKKFYQKEKLLFWQWFVIFLSLFWLRFIFNLVTGAAIYATGRLHYNGDEFRISLSI